MKRALLALLVGAGLAHVVSRLRDRIVGRRPRRSDPSTVEGWRHIFRGGTRL